MIKEISITVQPQDEKNESEIKKQIISQLRKDKISFLDKELNYVFQKKSIDARHGQLKLYLKYKVYIGENPESENKVPVWKNASGDKKVVIIGSGPAGLFAALRFLEKGIKPIIIERGEQTQERKKSIAKISTQDNVDPNSNYCFGEGGAGTFSDGKLYTRSNKRGNIDSILNIFAYFGADKKILTDAHPHIGTEKLPSVINKMRDQIIQNGGEFHFETQCVDFIIEGGVIKGVQTKNTKTGEDARYLGDAVLLSTGHSATDIYQLVAKKNPASLQAKTFAAGVRVEHSRMLIDAIQYHGKISDNLPAAEYRITTQVEERGVYSFCMCPGGFIVPSSTGPDEIVVNGMSASERNSKWSNAAIVVEIRPEDIPHEFVEEAKENGCEALASLYFRTWLEKQAKLNGQGQKAPAQRMVDFINEEKSKTLPATSYTPGVVSSKLGDWLPPFISERLKIAFSDFNKRMRGYICDDALLVAIESRTSTPVRILRDKDSAECVGIKGLYPCGEGSGYSGGIVSSAMDGENSADKIIEQILK